MNVVITGGCGFIGSGLVRRLSDTDTHAVRVIDNLSVGTRADLAAATTFSEVPAGDLDGWHQGTALIVGDILDEALARTGTQGADLIVHLAGNTGVQPSITNPRLDCLNNVIGTLNYLEAARVNGVPRLVFASSGGTVIGDAEPPVHEEMVPHPKSPYGASKSAGEGYLSAYHATFGITTVGLRFGNVYGPGSIHKGSIVAKFMRRALEGSPLEIYGDGDQTRDFIYLDDLLDALVRASMSDGVGGEIFQIASAAETSVNEIADRIVVSLREAGVVDVEVQRAAPLPGEIRRNYSDTSKAERLLGWRPATDLDEGLRRTVAWFIERRSMHDHG